jgi:EpsI family protein
MVMRSNRLAFVIAALMIAASIGAVMARPDRKAAAPGPAFSLEAMVPRHFGDWREEARGIMQLVNPQQQAALDAVYGQVLERVYVNTNGYRIMLSVAYGSDHRGSFRTHEPEYCYPGQGFVLHRREVTELETPFGELPVRRLFTSKGPRQEPVTYWIKVGDKAVRPSQSKLVELGYILTGRTPDGMLFRVSSIDPEQSRANRMHDQFINQLLQAMSPAERMRLSGLGSS